MICILLAVLLPAGCHGVFERQVRRLEALAEHGEVTTASVTRVTDTYAEYTYAVSGSTFTWSVSDERAPRGLGDTFAVLYLPEVPSFTRAGIDRARVSAEASSNRSFSAKFVGGVAYVFGFSALLCHLRVRRLRKTGQTEATDAGAYRTRLLLTAAFFVPILASIFASHAREAAGRGESGSAVVLGAIVGAAVLGGSVFYGLREGRAHAAARSARMMRWLAPVLFVSAALRALVWLLGG